MIKTSAKNFFGAFVPLTIMLFTLQASFLGASARGAPSGARATAHTKPSVNATAGKKKATARAKKKALDYNAMGTAAFKKNQLSEANKFFQLAVKNDSKNPISWVNSARVTIAMNIQNEPVDYCDYAKNWIFDSLALVSRAWDLDHAKTAAAFKTAREPSFAKFRKRPEFRNWSVIQTLPLKTAAATEEFFTKYNDWLIRKNPLPATVVTFAPAHELTISPADGAREVGTWTVTADHVILETKASKRTVELSTDNFVYLGSKSFKVVVLKDNSRADRLVMGPEIADCPQ